MFAVSVPNQMPKLCDGALVVNSAISVGTLVAKLGVVDDHRPAELCPVSTLMCPAPKAESATDCRLGSPFGTTLIVDGASLFATNGSAKAATLAVRPSNATIEFSFIYNSLRWLAPKTEFSDWCGL